MSEYLIQEGSNVVFVATPELLARGDMRPYQISGAKPVAPAQKEPDMPLDEGTENKPVQSQSVILPGEMKPAMDAKAEMEAIDDPDAMVDFILNKYGIKLPKTMKKSTMIERALESVNDDKAA